jgi:hypothetical protein
MTIACSRRSSNIRLFLGCIVLTIRGVLVCKIAFHALTGLGEKVFRSAAVRRQELMLLNVYQEHYGLQRLVMQASK